MLAKRGVTIEMSMQNGKKNITPHCPQIMAFHGLLGFRVTIGWLQLCVPFAFEGIILNDQNEIEYAYLEWNHLESLDSGTCPHVYYVNKKIYV